MMNMHHRASRKHINYGRPVMALYGNVAYLHEGVLATIEVKTKLTQKDLEQACRTSITHQKLKYIYPGVEGIMIDLTRPRSIVPYVVAFDGPEMMATVAAWMLSIQQEMEIEAKTLE